MHVYTRSEHTYVGIRLLCLHLYLHFVHVGILPLFQIKPPSKELSLTWTSSHAIHPKYKVLRGVRVFAPPTLVFGKIIIPKDYAVKHHLPPQKKVVFVEFLRKAFIQIKLQLPQPKTNPGLPGALSQPSILHLPGTKVGFPPFFGGGDGWTVPSRRVTMVPPVFCVIKLPLASQHAIPWPTDQVWLDASPAMASGCPTKDY